MAVDVKAVVTLPFLHMLRGVPAYAEMSLKWALNSISTAAQIAKVGIRFAATKSCLLDSRTRVRRCRRVLCSPTG